MAILTDSQLFLREQILEDCLTSDKTSWQDQVLTATNDLSVIIIANRLENIDSRVRQAVEVPFVLGFIFNYIRRADDDIYARKADYYMRRYNTALQLALTNPPMDEDPDDTDLDGDTAGGSIHLIR